MTAPCRRASAGTAWTRCDSWYRDEQGRIVTNWPGYMREYRNQTSELDEGEFRLHAAARHATPRGARSDARRAHGRLIVRGSAA